MKPCKEYPLEKIQELFVQHGSPTVDAYGVLNLDMPDVAKIWMLTETRLTTQEQRDAVIAKMAALMPLDSDEYASFIEMNAINYKYPMLYIVRTTGRPSRVVAAEIVSQIVQFFREVI